MTTRWSQIGKIILWNILLCATPIVALFLVFDFFPGIIQINGYFMPYLGMRYDYDVDPLLVFKGRVTHRVFQTNGALYREDYRKLGVEPSPVTMDITIGPSGFREDFSGTRADILMLGDSFLQIAESNSDSLGRRLQATSGITTLDRGLAWYGPFQYLEVFKRVGPSSGAKIALMCFYEGNDLSDIREYMHWQNGGGYYDHYMIHPDTTIFGRFALFLEDLWGIRGRMPGKIPAIPYRNELVEINLKGQAVHARFSNFPENRTVQKISQDEDGRALANILSEFKTLAESEGIHPAVVFIPSSVHVYGNLVTANSGATWKQKQDVILANLDHVEEFVKKVSRANNLDIIDLVPPFQAKAKKGQLLFYPFDSHWNSAGRQLAAEVITRHLSNLGNIAFAK